ncbi:MAG: two-component system sensor histidine kinase NtrB [Rhabdochlamydiaceae bacterium]
MKPMKGLTIFPLIDHIDQGILVVDHDNQIIYKNKQIDHLFVHSISLPCLYEEFYKDNFFGFSLKEALNKKAVDFSISHNKEIDGQTFQIKAFGSSDSTDYHLYILLTKIDKNTDYGKKERLADLGEMLVFLAHEIKNPLAALHGFASLLYQDLRQYTHLKFMSKKILEGISSLDNLVEKILTFTQDLPLDLQQTDIKILVQNVIEFARPTIPPHINISTSFVEELPILLVDQDQIRSVILNLLKNAVDAMPDGGQIDILVKSENNKTVFSIQDNGTGIEKTELSRIFHPFFTTKKTGNGIGLAHINKIIKAHKGHIDVISEKNQGTCFTIWL